MAYIHGVSGEERCCKRHFVTSRWPRMALRTAGLGVCDGRDQLPGPNCRGATGWNERAACTGRMGHYPACTFEVQVEAYTEGSTGARAVPGHLWDPKGPGQPVRYLEPFVTAVTVFVLLQKDD